MDDLYHSGSILVFIFSGVSGSAFLSNNYDHSIPVSIEEDKAFIHLDKTITKSQLINNYMFLRTDGYYISKYKMTI